MLPRVRARLGQWARSERRGTSITWQLVVSTKPSTVPAAWIGLGLGLGVGVGEGGVGEGGGVGGGEG